MEPEFDLDWDTHSDISTEDGTEIEDCSCPLTEDQLRELSATVNPLEHTDNYGIGLYHSVLEFVKNNSTST